MVNREIVSKEVPNIIEENINRLQNLFPEVFSEGKINFDRLKATMGDIVDTNPERYSFTWSGKRQAIQLLQTPSRATLLPCKEESIKFNTTENIFIEGDNLEP